MDVHQGRTPLPFQKNDGGRREAGYTGTTGDCVTRAVAIGTEQEYGRVYDILSEGQRDHFFEKLSKVPHPSLKPHLVGRKSVGYTLNGKTRTRNESARTGVRRTVYFCVEALGKMLPDDRTIICCVWDWVDRKKVSAGKAGHYTTLINGVVHDMGNTTKWRVNGYWQRGAPAFSKEKKHV